VSHPTYFDNLN